MSAILALIGPLINLLTSWLDYKTRREAFDLANAVSDRQAVVQAQIDTATARGDVATADRLRDQYAAIAGAAGASLIPAADAKP